MQFLLLLPKPLLDVLRLSLGRPAPASAAAAQLPQPTALPQAACPGALRTMARWTPRLQDLSYQVRVEAVTQLVAVANEHPAARQECLASLLTYFRDTLPRDRYRDDAHGALHALKDLDIQILASQEELLLAALDAPVDFFAESAALMSLAWSLLGDSAGHLGRTPHGLAPDHPAVPRMLEAARAAQASEHHGGRCDALKILDWAEDHGLPLPPPLEPAAAHELQLDAEVEATLQRHLGELGLNTAGCFTFSSPPAVFTPDQEAALAVFLAGKHLDGTNPSIH